MKKKSIQTPVFKKYQGGSISVSKHLELYGIELEIKATRDDWRKLDEIWFKDDGDITKEIYWQIIMPLMEWLDSRKPRGKNKETQPFVEKLQREAAWLYTIIQYWCGRPLGEWPEHLKRLVDGSEIEDFVKYYRATKGFVVAQELTLHHMKELYEDEALRLGLRPFDKPTSFYRKYIHADKRPATIRRGFLKGRKPDEVAKLAYSNSILRRLLKIS